MDSILNNDAYLKNALVLAYLGDAVFNLRTRDFLVKSYDYKPNQLNKMANSIVCAKNQADIMKILKQELNILTAGRGSQGRMRQGQAWGPR